MLRALDTRVVKLSEVFFWIMSDAVDQNNQTKLWATQKCSSDTSFVFFQPIEVSKALQARQVAGRKVCVNLLKLGRWFYGFRLPDEHESHKISLTELTMAERAEILAILNRGAVHEVFRLQISWGTQISGIKVCTRHYHKYLLYRALCKYV